MKEQRIRLFGLGCNLSKRLLDNVQQAASEQGVRLVVEEVTDIQEMMDLGITAIPALQMGKEVVLSGQVPEVEELKALFGNALKAG